MIMDFQILLTVLVVSSVGALDETTTDIITTENEHDETTTYEFSSSTTTTVATSTADSSSSSSWTITYPTTSSTSTSRTSTTNPNDNIQNEWNDMEEKEADVLVKFVVGEIQKLKVEHKELDDCQELDLSSVLSGKKQVGKPTKYSVTLKVQPQMKDTEECKHENSTVVNMHPEICEADILEGDHGGTTSGKTLLRSTCLQVEELQD